jgi:hypothetical protein
MASTSFSFHFIPEEDRIALTFQKQTGIKPPPVLLTRRMVKHLGRYLRHFIEQNTTLPESVSAEDKGEVLQFMHQSELESNQPTMSSGKNKEQSESLKAAKLVTKVDIQTAKDAVKFLCYKHNSHLVSFTLGWHEMHSFLYSLAELSQQAEWRLEDVFDWSGRAVNAKGEGKRMWM